MTIYWMINRLHVEGLNTKGEVYNALVNISPREAEELIDSINDYIEEKEAMS